MNLSNMMRDASLSNLQWLNNPETYLPQNKDNDKKDDLELQWGMGDFALNDGKYQDSPEKAKDGVQTNNAAEISQKTREYFNQGMSERECLVVLLASYPKEQVIAAKAATASIRKLGGILGRVAVDVRGYKNPKDALKDAAKSPYKKFIKYVVGHTGDNVVALTDNTGSVFDGTVVASTGNAADDFLASEKPVANTRLYSKALMMPILAHSFDLDQSEADSNLMELNAGGYLTSEEVEQIKAENKTAYSQIRSAFLLIDLKKQAVKASKYSEKVSNEEFKMKKSEINIVLSKKIKASAVEVEDIMPRAEPITLPDSTHIAAMKNVEIEKDAGLKVSISKKKKASLDFKVKKASMNVEYPKASESPMEVEEQTWVDPAFKGGDEIKLDDEKTPLKPFEVDGRGDFSW